MKNAKKGKHIVTSYIEHGAVYRTAQFLETHGFEVTYLPAGQYGGIVPEQLEYAIRDDTVLVSIMLANNEIGTIQPIKELCRIAHKRNIPFHTDAVQAVGHIPVNVRDLGVDMLSLSAHKFRRPKGIGALYVKLGRILPPMIIGGGQEKTGAPARKTFRALSEWRRHWTKR
jgi:cysteine desulfurase